MIPYTLDRKRQGIPCIERTASGRLFVNWCSGMETETGGHSVVVTSSDDGDSFNGARFVVAHDDPEVRVYDPCLRREPLDGAWAATTENPDDDEPEWSRPRRLAHGSMMNKPTVRSDGAWLVPTAIWACHTPTEHHGLEVEQFSNIYVTHDRGATFALLGGADIPDRGFDEHMVVERRDGPLWMLVHRFDGIGEGVTVVVVEHKVEELAVYADRLVVMQEGVLRQAGTPREVLAGGRTRRIGRRCSTWRCGWTTRGTGRATSRRCRSHRLRKHGQDGSGEEAEHE